MMTMYEPSFDPSDLAKQKLKGGFWVALDHTEKWIQSTLEGMPQGHYNFSYECDMSQSVLQSIASIFRYVYWNWYSKCDLTVLTHIHLLWNINCTLQPI